MQTIKQLWHPLRHRIYVIIFVYLTIIAVLASLSVFTSQKSSYLLERAGKSYQQLQLFSQLSSDIQHHFNRQLEALIQGKPTDELLKSQKTLEKQFINLQQLIKAEVELVDDLEEKEEEEEELKQQQLISQALDQLLSQALQTYSHIQHKVNTEIQQHDRTQALSFFSQQVLQNYQQQLKPLLDAAIADEQSEINEVEAQMTILQQQLNHVVILSLVISSIVVLLLIYVLSTALLRPLTQLTQATDEMALGKLHVRSEISSVTEFASVSRHFNTMAEQLEQQHKRLADANSLLEKKVAERTQSLKQSNDQLRRLDQSRRRFLEDVSHELRSPATILMGEADLALRSKENDAETYQTTLKTIKAHCGFLKRRIEDLLALAHADNGVLKLQNEPILLDELITQITNSLSSFAQIKQVQLSHNISQPCIAIEGDPSWLKQLVMTLVDNAIKFTPAQKQVVLTLEQDETHALLTIHDQGKGIAPDQLPHLFERYYQADNQPKQDQTPSRSYGLGLAIAHWIVEQHQGEVSVSSQTNQGTTVAIRLPLLHYGD